LNTQRKQQGFAGKGTEYIDDDRHPSGSLGTFQQSGVGYIHFNFLFD
jgi:hypothetical protein